MIQTKDSSSFEIETIFIKSSTQEDSSPSTSQGVNNTTDRPTVPKDLSSYNLKPCKIVLKQISKDYLDSQHSVVDSDKMEETNNHRQEENIIGLQENQSDKQKAPIEEIVLIDEDKDEVEEEESEDYFRRRTRRHDQEERKGEQDKLAQEQLSKHKAALAEFKSKLSPKDEIEENKRKNTKSFTQNRSCYRVSRKQPKCRECRKSVYNKKEPSIQLCRFYAFRRFTFNDAGQLTVEGFFNKDEDVSSDDFKIWLPLPSLLKPEDLDEAQAVYLITLVGDQFCDLVQSERDAINLHIGKGSFEAQKNLVEGIREMCDICDTTLFNVHWNCDMCGFVVCVDCYKARTSDSCRSWKMAEGIPGLKQKDEFSWLLCTETRRNHEKSDLMLTKTIAKDALENLCETVHRLRYKWGIPMYCKCEQARKFETLQQENASAEENKVNGVSHTKGTLTSTSQNGIMAPICNGAKETVKPAQKSGKSDDYSSPLNFFADVALSCVKMDDEDSDSSSDSSSEDDDNPDHLSLRSLLGAGLGGGGGNSANKSNNKRCSSREGTTTSGDLGGAIGPRKKKAKLETLDNVLSVILDKGGSTTTNGNVKSEKETNSKLEHYVSRYQPVRKGREQLPIRIMTKTESKLLYPGIPHSWLCDGKLLRLHDPLSADNIQLFQDQWKRGQPVIVSNTGHALTPDMWTPKAFSRDFGDVKNHLINCLTNNIVPNQPLSVFWDGFEYYNKRLEDECGLPMILKVKDWPPGDDFAELLPDRFADLMRVLPMPKYTLREGYYNLASHLPKAFVPPDLGPKMYIAYGAATNPSKASTNLHLDISDAANVMCYVGIPKDVDVEQNVKETMNAINEGGCDVLTRHRVQEPGVHPGAIWQIYHARDSDKIRDLLNKVAIERGKKLEPHHDPIHDQSWNLDSHLRDRLYKEYGVEGYTIVQCAGDSVFIPAGAPHQVRNLHNCIKVAEDFVSPETISHCFHLTQEFRHLSHSHTNHEDKLQIKNIIYHAIKDAIACLIASEDSKKDKTPGKVEEKEITSEKIEEKENTSEKIKEKENTSEKIEEKENTSEKMEEKEKVAEQIKKSAMCVDQNENSANGIDEKEQSSVGLEKMDPIAV